jgi:hypothetical protein
MRWAIPGAALRRSLLTGSALVAMLGTATPAEADTASIITRTCADAGTGRNEVSLRRLAVILLADNGVVIEPPADPTLPRDDEVSWIRRAVATPGVERSAAQQAVFNAIGGLQVRLGSQSGPGPEEAGLVAVPAGPGARPDGWLVAENVRLFCHKEAPRTGGSARSTGSGGLDLRLRGTPDELSLTDDDPRRLTAGAATLSYQRERIEQTDGTRRHDTTIGVKAALGVVLAQSQAGDSAILFGAYQLQRLRTRPRPTLAPGATERAKDTDVLEIGLNARRLFGRGDEGPFNLDVTGRGSILFDRVANSERLRFAVTAVPDIRLPLPICNFGEFDPIGLGLAGRCTLTFRAQANIFLDRGTRAPTANDEFALAGGVLALEIAEWQVDRLKSSGGVIAGATYRYEVSLLGAVPNIHRFSTFLKYRRWFDERRFAIEGGINYVDGINPDSFADEHRITFGVGFIF